MLKTNAHKLKIATVLLSGIACAGCATQAQHGELYSNENRSKENVSKIGLKDENYLGEKNEQDDLLRQVNNTEIATLEASQALSIEDAIALAAVDNPTVRIAIESIKEAEAKKEAADALRWPSLNAGFNFHIHRGNLQRSPGTILSVDSQSLYFGGGARTLAAETVAFPGIRAFYPLSEVIIEPAAAEQKLTARRAETTELQNSTALQVAMAYLELQAALLTLEQLNSIKNDMDEIVRLTESFAKTGQGRDVDFRRALANRELVQKDIDEATGKYQIASAHLSALMNIDPTIRLRPTSSRIVPWEIIDITQESNELIAQAESTRPELAARFADVNEANLRETQEKIKPWLPTIIAGYSLGGIGGGSNLTTSQFGRFDTRSDLDVTAFWTFQNLGFGNRANVYRASALRMQSIANLEISKNKIREEVTTAQAEAIAERDRMRSLDKKLEIAMEGYAEELKRVKQGQGLPLELLDSARSLTETRLEIIQSIKKYNASQFKLQTAIGIPVSKNGMKQP